jgi:hypothetical protein
MPNNQLRNLASLGRYGDTMLAHINPQEAALLKSMGGAGTINPKTGLREFWDYRNGNPPSTYEAPFGSYDMRAGPPPAPAPFDRSFADINQLGMGVQKITGYTLPSDQKFADIPLVTKYDPKGNFNYVTLEPGKYLTPDPSQPNIVSVPRLDASGNVVDWGISDLNNQDNGSFGSFIRGVASDFAPMILAGLGANFAAGNFGGLAGGGAAAGGATAADIAAHNALAAANTAGYAGTSLASTAAGLGAGTLADIATTSPVLPQTPLTGTPLADFGAAAAAGGGATAADIAAHEALAAANTAGGLTAADVAAAAAASAGAVGGASAADIAAHEALANANIASGLTPANVAAAAAAAAAGGGLGGAGSVLSSLLPKTPAELAALASGAGSVVSGAVAANAAEKAAQIQADAATKAAQIQQEMFNTINAQGVPYRAAGYNALNQIGGMLPGQYTQYDATGKPVGQATGTGYLTQQYGPEQFQKDIDPGYAFRLQQGQMANQRASNLAGGLIGGNAMRGMQDYTQGMASQEFGNAFNRFQTQRGNIYNTLAGIAGIGQTAQGQANQAAQTNATAQGQLGVGAAAAQAAGQIGQAAGYGGAASGLGNAYLLSQLLKQNQGVALP